MNELIKVQNVEPLAVVLRWRGEGRRFSGLLEAGGVFAPIRESRKVLEQVRVNPESQTVEWLGEVDLDPDVLYGRYEPASGVRIERRIVREPSSAGHA
jgi:hypothetical protein